VLVRRLEGERPADVVALAPEQARLYRAPAFPRSAVMAAVQHTLGICREKLKTTSVTTPHNALQPLQTPFLDAFLIFLPFPYLL
jgi:hypothetical protein